MKILHLFGKDEWGYPTYKDAQGCLYKDLSMGNGPTVHLYTVSNNFDIDSEPEFLFKGEYTMELKKHYVTFGQQHTHTIGNKHLNKDTVARFETLNAQSGRKKAFELFDKQFCFEYHDTEWNDNKMIHFSGGYVDLP